MRLTLSRLQTRDPTQNTSTTLLVPRRGTLYLTCPKVVSSPRPHSLWHFTSSHAPRPPSGPHTSNPHGRLSVPGGVRRRFQAVLGGIQWGKHALGFSAPPPQALRSLGQPPPEATELDVELADRPEGWARGPPFGEHGEDDRQRCLAVLELVPDSLLVGLAATKRICNALVHATAPWTLSSSSVRAAQGSCRGHSAVAGARARC